ncbi:uncharacterized protein LOC143921317 [Arctopsyche grandis]|uniref:uncharacterized protein LOC143921317 n=1 Tax=Arctopsyche grandis TaxID=121162 RepID=UPI00406D77BF
MELQILWKVTCWYYCDCAAYRSIGPWDFPGTLLRPLSLPFRSRRIQRIRSPNLLKYLAEMAQSVLQLPPFWIRSECWREQSLRKISIRFVEKHNCNVWSMVADTDGAANTVEGHLLVLLRLRGVPINWTLGFSRHSLTATQSPVPFQTDTTNSFPQLAEVFG